MGGPDSIRRKALKQSLALSLWRKAAADFLLFALKKETVMLEDGQVAGGGL